MTFGEWLESERMTGNTDVEYLSAWLGWTAGQQAEREKHQELIAAAEAVLEEYYQYGGQLSDTMDNLCELLEKLKEKSNG